MDKGRDYKQRGIMKKLLLLSYLLLQLLHIIILFLYLIITKLLNKNYINK